MKTCFYAPAGEMNESLRRAIQSALGSTVIDLSQTLPHAWKEAIAGADLIFIDVTAANPTACYVAGIADAAAKRTILLSPIAETIPAILGSRATIVHRWNLDHLKTELQKFAAPEAEAAAPSDDTPAGKFHKLFGDLLRAHGYAHRGPVEFDGSTFTVREQEMELPLVQEIAARAKSLSLRVRLL